LTVASSDDPSIDGPSNRRRFSDEEKLAIVRESDAPNVSAAEVCRRHGMSPACCSRGGFCSDLADGHG
jgi:transposase-like protein